MPLLPSDCNKPLNPLSAKQHKRNKLLLDLSGAGNLLNLSDELWHRDIQPSISSTSNIFPQLLSAMINICKPQLTFNWHKNWGEWRGNKQHTQAVTSFYCKFYTPDPFTPLSKPPPKISGLHCHNTSPPKSCSGSGQDSASLLF